LISERRRAEAKKNLVMYIQEGLIKKETNEVAFNRFIENAQLSLATANEQIRSKLKPHL